MKQHKFSSHKKKIFSARPSKQSRQCGDFNSSISEEENTPLSKKWNEEDDHQNQQIAGNQAKARKTKKFAGRTSGIKVGQDAAKEGKLKYFSFSSGIAQHTNAVTPRLVSVNNLVHEDSDSVPPKKITKDESTGNLVAAETRVKRRSRLLKQRCSGGLWLLKSCDLLNIGRVPLFMMQRKLFPITACGKLQSEKLRARRKNYRLLDFVWMWFQKGFWKCSKKTLRGRIDKALSYLKVRLQRYVRPGRRPNDMNNKTSGILYEIPQCTTRSCLRDDAAVKLPNVEAPFGNVASSVSLLKDSEQTLLYTPAPWCCTDTFIKKTSDVPFSHQPDDTRVLLHEKVFLSCQQETTAYGEKDAGQIPLTPDRVQECARNSFGCQGNASMEMVENGDESCPMGLDDSTDSDIFSTKLLDHPYCKSPMQQTACGGLDIQGIQNGQKTISHVPDEQVASCICDFLNEVVKKYGSLIPVTEKDIFTRLKEVFNQDFSNRIPFISKELAKHRARNSTHNGCGFEIRYNKHTLYMEDLITLDEQQWLNDQVINMYGDLITEVAPEKIYFFNTFFHKQLVTKGYDGVKRWTKKVDLFKKTLLLIPIHLQVHWALVAVHVQNKTIVFYDSQGLHLKFCTENILKYILTEAKERNCLEFLHGWQTTIKKCIPQQKNDFDCGVFMLQYCKCLAQEEPFLFSQEDMPCIRKSIYKELCELRLMD